MQRRAELTALLLALVVSGVTSYGSHACRHDAFVASQPPALSYNQSYDMPTILRGRRASADGFLASTAAYQPLRIKALFSGISAASTGMDAGKVTFLQDVLIPAVVAEWGKILSVERVSGPLFASRFCASAYVAIPPRCAAYAVATQCGSSTGAAGEDVKIEFQADQLGAQMFYSPNYNTAVTAPAGVGVADADFAMFITAASVSGTCPTTQGASGTLAYALTCQRDQYDRPTWGRINFCPYALSNATADYAQNFAVAMHEFAHALGFSSSSWPLFRNWDAARSPVTPRDLSDLTNGVSSSFKTTAYTCGGNSFNKTPHASNASVAYFAERGMTQCSASTAGPDPSSCVAKLTGPRTTVAAREHFDCASLGGAELENHLTTACTLQGSHWEQRVLSTELMSSYLQHVSPISAITLAVFEDSGWYKADYSKAGTWRKGMDWGYKQGCAFADGLCLVSGVGAGSPPHFFSTGTTGTEKRCSSDRAGFGYVSISTFSSALPAQYRYFNDSMMGGDSFLDYCPAVRLYSNGRCSVSTNFNAGSHPFYGQSYGPSSACFETSLAHSSVLAGGTGAGCMSYTCSGSAQGAYTLTITAVKDGVPQSGVCTSAMVGSTVTVTDYTGSITCPNVDAMCIPPAVLLPSFLQLALSPSSTASASALATATTSPSTTASASASSSGTGSATSSASGSGTASSSPSATSSATAATASIKSSSSASATATHTVTTATSSATTTLNPTTTATGTATGTTSGTATGTTSGTAKGSSSGTSTAFFQTFDVSATPSPTPLPVPGVVSLVLSLPGTDAVALVASSTFLCALRRAVGNASGLLLANIRVVSISNAALRTTLPVPSGEAGTGDCSQVAAARMLLNPRTQGGLEVRLLQSESILSAELSLTVAVVGGELAVSDKLKGVFSDPSALDRVMSSAVRAACVAQGTSIASCPSPSSVLKVSFLTYTPSTPSSPTGSGTSSAIMIGAGVGGGVAALLCLLLVIVWRRMGRQAGALASSQAGGPKIAVSVGLASAFRIQPRMGAPASVDNPFIKRGGHTARRGGQATVRDTLQHAARAEPSSASVGPVDVSRTTGSSGQPSITRPKSRPRKQFAGGLVRHASVSVLLKGGAASACAPAPLATTGTAQAPNTVPSEDGWAAGQSDTSDSDSDDDESAVSRPVAFFASFRSFRSSSKSLPSTPHVARAAADKAAVVALTDVIVEGVPAVRNGAGVLFFRDGPSLPSRTVPSRLLARGWRRLEDGDGDVWYVTQEGESVWEAQYVSTQEAAEAVA